ncbi:MAG TPA: hypothetical protein VGN80_10960 [Devosiaceae bacterium]|jgi:hypothetical protein|nr:hypothetical protein [Devosiaceae bacterium]
MPRNKSTPADVTDLDDWRASRRPETNSAAPRKGPGAGEDDPVLDGTLRVLVFATDRDGTAEASAPFVIIPEAAASFLPAHPGGLEWRYFATMRLDDQMLAEDRAVITAALHDPGYYITDKPVHG